MEEQKYSISDFVYWLEKYNDIDEKKYTQAQIASIIGRGMVDFFDDSNTTY